MRTTTNREGMLVKQAVVSLFAGDALANWTYLQHHIPANGLTSCQMLMMAVLTSALDDLELGHDEPEFWSALNWITGVNNKLLVKAGRYTARECWEHTIGDQPLWEVARQTILARWL